MIHWNKLKLLLTVFMSDQKIRILHLKCGHFHIWSFKIMLMQKWVHFQKLKHKTMNSAAYSVIECDEQSENTKWISVTSETSSFRFPDWNDPFDQYDGIWISIALEKPKSAANKQSTRIIMRIEKKNLKSTPTTKEIHYCKFKLMNSKWWNLTILSKYRIYVLLSNAITKLVIAIYSSNTCTSMPGQHFVHAKNSIFTKNFAMKFYFVNQFWWQINVNALSI